jgi:Leucine-rich repeat (LRR) protein
MRKFIERPKLVSVWAISCPGLLKSKTNELALQEPGTQMYLTTLAEKMRIDMLYDAIAHLKNIESTRPVRPADIESKLTEVDKLAAAEGRKIEAQEGVEANELRDIGDGSESMDAWVKLITQAQKSKTLILRGQGLFAVPPELFALVSDMEIVDLGDNQITEVPHSIDALTSVKKIYLDANRLTSIPTCIAKMHEHLTLLALADNPLQAELLHAYLAGLPRLFAFLRERRLVTARSGKAASRNNTRASFR